MIFGRKRKQQDDDASPLADRADDVTADELDDDLDTDEQDVDDEDEAVESADDDADDDDELGEDDDELDDDDEDDDLDDDDDDDEDDVEPVDDSLRDDGPFDIDEVDLDADDVERLDLGSVIVTPFEDMQLQLQVDEATQAVQAALVMVNQSALEFALFAAPARHSMVREVVEDMQRGTTEAGGDATLTEGRFGPQIRRVLPVQTPDGQDALHVSDTWFAQGPRWLLRGTLMGQAVTGEAQDDAELLEEFFCNLVVRRDAEPRVPGDLIPMSLPPNIVPDNPGATS